MDKPTFIKRKKLSEEQKECYLAFSKAIKQVEHTPATCLFLSSSNKHHNFDVMFWDDPQDIVFKTKNAFKEIKFPEYIEPSSIALDSEWYDSHLGMQLCYANYDDFMESGYATNNHYIDKWLGEAFNTLDDIEKHYNCKHIYE